MLALSFWKLELYFLAKLFMLLLFFFHVLPLRTLVITLYVYIFENFLLIQNILAFTSICGVNRVDHIYCILVGLPYWKGKQLNYEFCPRNQLGEL